MVNRTGYTGEEGVELACMADDAERLWDAVVGRGVTPCGLGARDTLRLEVCYPLHGNDIGPQWDAISSGLGWACALDTEFTGVERLREVSRARPGAEARRLPDDREGDPPAGHGDRGRRRGDVGLAVADARRRHRARLRAGAAGEDRNRAGDRRAREAPPRRGRQETVLQARGAEPVPRASPTPRNCSTTPSTTGRGSTATKPCSESPGTPRTRSASWCTTSRRTSARPSPRTPPTARSNR